MTAVPISSLSVVSRHRALAGVGFALVTVVIWAVWIVATRQAATVHLPAAWLGILRFAVPAIVLLPFWWPVGLLPKGVDMRLVALMVAGSGAPFFLVVATGMRYASAAESGILLGGTMPFFVALLSALVDGERFSRSRLVGFGAVLLALLLIGGSAILAGQGFGRLLVPLGAALWAAYTLAFRRSGISAIAAAGIIAAWSTLLLLPLALLEGTAEIMAAGPRAILGQIASQGVLSGVIALICYGAAVARLGASRAAVFAALPPALAALIAIPVLGEMPTPLTYAGIALAVAGVGLGSGAISLGKAR